MGAFWQIIQTRLAREQFKVSDRQLAHRLGVSPTTIGNWRGGLKALPAERNLRSVADFAGKSYEAVLFAALSETGHARGTRLEAGWQPVVITTEAMVFNPIPAEDSDQR